MGGILNLFLIIPLMIFMFQMFNSTLIPMINAESSEELHKILKSEDLNPIVVLTSSITRTIETMLDENLQVEISNTPDNKPEEIVKSDTDIKKDVEQKIVTFSFGEESYKEIDTPDGISPIVYRDKTNSIF